MAPSASSLLSHARDMVPHLTTSTHLILSALFPIFAGAHASLAQPRSATRPNRKRVPKDAEDDSTDSEPKDSGMETLSPTDALMFPLLAGCMLGSLYLLIKYCGAELLNRIVGAYMSIMSVASVGQAGADALRVIGGLVFPSLYWDDQSLWIVSASDKAVVGPNGTRSNPLPARLGRANLGATIEGWLWTARGVLGSKYELKAVIASNKIRVTLKLRTAIMMLTATAAVAYGYFVHCPWWLTNIQGFALSYAALQMISTGTFGTGSLVLVALFFYDIYFVFYTPLMVSVAENLDVPIKLVIPRSQGGRAGYSMLGLGDIVLPGIVMALALRFDLYMHYLRLQTKDEGRIVKTAYRSVSTLWGEKVWTLLAPRSAKGKTLTDDYKLDELLPVFRKTYFYASVIGYVLGMCTTLTCMHLWQHAQPALLYLVPAVLGAIWLTALARGEVAEMWNYSEIEDARDDDKDVSEREKDDKADKTLGDDKDIGKTGDGKGKGKDKGSSGIETVGDRTTWYSTMSARSYWFSKERTERNAQRLEKMIVDTVKVDKPDADAAAKGRWKFSFSLRPVLQRPHTAPTSPKQQTEPCIDADAKCQ